MLAGVSLTKFVVADGQAVSHQVVGAAATLMSLFPGKLINASTETIGIFSRGLQIPPKSAIRTPQVEGVQLVLVRSGEEDPSLSQRPHHVGDGLAADFGPASGRRSGVVAGEPDV
jgi:hypothetical protein